MALAACTHLPLRWTWCSLYHVVFATAAHPSSYDSVQRVAAHQRCWRRRHRAEKPKREAGHSSSAGEHTPGPAGVDTVPCYASRMSGARQSARHPGLPTGRCPVLSAVMGRRSGVSVRDLGGASRAAVVSFAVQLISCGGGGRCGGARCGSGAVGARRFW